MMIVALVLAILAPLIARLLYFACSRQREYLADASAAQYTRLPSGLANALRKISTQQEPKKIPVNRVVSPMYIINPLAAAGTVVHLRHASADRRTHPAPRGNARGLRPPADAGKTRHQTHNQLYLNALARGGFSRPLSRNGQTTKIQMGFAAAAA